MLIAAKRPYWVYPVLLSLFLSLNNFAVIAQPGNIKAVMSVEATKLYDAGKSALEAKNFSEAIRKFQLLNFKYPDYLYQESVQLYLIYCLQGAKQYEEAIKAVDLFIKNYPESTRYQDVLALKKVLEKQNAHKQTQNDAKKFLLVAGAGAIIVSIIMRFGKGITPISKGDKPSSSGASTPSNQLSQKCSTFKGFGASFDANNFKEIFVEDRSKNKGILAQEFNPFNKDAILKEMEKWDPKKSS